ncbi:hypothetical protein [Pseudomonas tohonis]|jgi:membrane-bound ClpP family serine protease|uniref:hypothetical protein n=1 Tax=Pseudomonas tohonis TaxID=2725477 RepID=UPI001F158659|nr:hypothetical protein [Pseudomonas tohonis]
MELTSKRFKAMMAVGVIAILVGVVWSMANSAGGGFLLMVGGFFLYVLGRFLAWWNHG